jgi:hypothetical protein
MTVTSAPPTSDGVVERAYAKWLMTIMAVGTVLFVLAQLFVGLTLRTLTYPVVAFPMFADAPKFEIEPVLTAVTADGVVHKLTFGDFGLTHDQLNFYVNRKIALNDGTLRMGASDKLQFLGQEWATKHGNPVLSSVSISFSKHALDGSGKVTVVPVDTWKASS